MFEYCNLNPHGLRVGDCVIRAISKALNQPWETSYLELSIQGYLMGDLLAANSVWGEYLKRKGFAREMISSDCPNCYCINDFVDEHPVGTYIVGTGTHATAIIDGTIYDIWNCGQEQPLYYYFRKENQEQIEQN